MSVRSIGFLLVTLLFSKVAAASPSPSASKPHLVFMLVDDWGWANVGYHRNPPTKEVVTPNIDSLVKQGVELDQHYAFQIGSPSRCSLISGRLPIHVNDVNDDAIIYNPDDPISGFAGIPRNMTGVASKMKEAGYATHQVGKWDAGMATHDHTPMGRGFNSSFGFFRHTNDYFTEVTAVDVTATVCNKTGPGPELVDLWDTDKPATGVNGTGPDKYEEGLFKERLLQVINNHDPSTPLFLYYAPHIVHAPLQVPDAYTTKFNFINDSGLRQYYHAMVNYLDDVVGELVDAMKKKGMWENTLFAASSDNGGAEYPGGGANNYPLRGGKMTDWQGGIRVNAFVSGGFLPMKMQGQKITGKIHLADWYATFCAIAGVDPADERAVKAKLPPIDSMNMWPLISGENTTSPRQDIPVSYDTLISGDFKILTGTMDQAGWTGPQYPNATNPDGGINATVNCGTTGCLFNITKDPEERVNIVETESAILKEMQQRLAKYQATYFSPNRGTAWPGACDKAMKDYGGFWGPFVP
jgi:arylsulfatase I/J